MSSIRQYIKPVAILNIGVQVLFPVVIAFTPSVIFASEDKLLSIILTTETYIIRQNESISDIAAKNNISVDDLEKLNKHRRFT